MCVYRSTNYNVISINSEVGIVRQPISINESCFKIKYLHVGDVEEENGNFEISITSAEINMQIEL